MALPHAQSGQLINVRPHGNELSAAPSRALVKTQELEVMRLVLPAGKTMPAHQVPGEVTLLCLEGAVELQAHGKSQVMRAGDLVYLRGNEPHALRAIEDASLLHTILLKRDSKDGNLTGRGAGNLTGRTG
ncbi:MAG: cupin domain-containing protein [Burkholderiales bacterium]|nr:cupin domain-containing protein [Burkholderiales bacterium]